MRWEPYIKVTVVGSRLPGWTVEDFSDYWRDHHGPLVADWLVRHDTIEYTQYHTLPEYKDLAYNMTIGVGRPLLEADGMAQFKVKKWEDFEAAFADPYYTEVVAPDERSFMDTSNLLMTVGVEYVVIEDNVSQVC